MSGMGAGDSEIPAASAGMTEKASAGMTEKVNAGVAEKGARVWQEGAGVTEVGRGRKCDQALTARRDQRRPIAFGADFGGV